MIPLAQILGTQTGRDKEPAGRRERFIQAEIAGEEKSREQPGLYTVTILTPVEFVQYDPDTGLVVIQRQLISHSPWAAIGKAGVQARESR